MKIAEMRHRIKIQQEVSTPDDMGGYSKTWETFKDVAAAIWPISSKEIRENMRLGSDVTHNVRIRYTTGVKPEMRVIFKNRVFEINLPINFNEQNVWLDMVCHEQY